MAKKARGRKGVSRSRGQDLISELPMLTAAAVMGTWTVVQPKMTLYVLKMIELWSKAPAEDRDFRAGNVNGFITALMTVFGKDVKEPWKKELLQYESFKEFWKKEILHRAQELGGEGKLSGEGL